MLVGLSVSNLAIIESIRLEFGSGFNLLTGETGAGKSIIIDAVALLLGGRASAELIRTGCETASVEGVFTLSPQVLASLKTSLQKYDLLDDSAELILRREISRQKRNVCRLNGRAVPLSLLQETGRHLIDIHGQGDHLSLLRVRSHVDFLDRFGNLWEQRQALGALVSELRQIRAELRALRQDEREMARRVDMLTYQVEEIEAADLRSGEERELERERNLLANAERLSRLSTQVYEAVSGGEEAQESISDLLGVVVDTLSALAKLDDSLEERSKVAENALYQLEDLARSIRTYRDEIEYDPKRLQLVEERIDLIRALKRKYGDSIEEVLAYGRRAQDELANIGHGEERTRELHAAERATMDKIALIGSELRASRKEAAERLCARMETELADLKMTQARFLIDMRWSEAPDGANVGGKSYAFGSTGFDRVEFLIAPNPGEAPKPLAKIASGGETSRLMLAMKTALSSVDMVPTLIFDEIDSGIGGRTGDVVGQKLRALAREHQVFCVTHLAQMACHGDRHFRVAKRLVGGRAVSTVQILSDRERIDELALMLGGVITEATRQSAEELVERATK